MPTLALRVKIDPDDLDTEILEQAQQVYEWGQEMADASRALDEADSNLKLCKAAADKALRGDPASYGLTKATDATVAHGVLEQPAVIEATDVWIEAKHRVAVTRAALDALQDRKRALTLLVELLNSQWFSETPVKPQGVRRGGARRGRD